MNHHKNAASKLPKQWMYWAKKNELRREFGHGNGHGKQGVHYLVGKGRRWRVGFVDGHEFFECSCPNEYFDRWANSRGSIINRIPKTESEFFNSVRELRELSMDAK